MKTCIKCKQLLPLENFSRNKNTKDRHQPTCKVCVTSYNKKYHKDNKDHKIAVLMEWKKKNPDKVKEIDRRYKVNSPEKVKEKNRKYRVNNSEKRKESARKTQRKRVVLGLRAAENAKRRAALLQRIPKWADLVAITEFYKKCPKGMVVDHIKPLQGKNISGFHVLENLQYLTPEENGSKWNKFKEGDKI